MSNNRPYPKPELVEKVEEQVGGDAKSAFGFLGKALDAFLGYDLNAEVAKSLNRPKHDYTSSAPIVSRQSSPTAGGHCNTCGGSREVGRKGYEIPCPACLPNACKTCKGSGKLGTAGFEILCPMCNTEPHK